MQPIGSEALRELEQTLHAEIPLTRAMGVRVVRADQNGRRSGPHSHRTSTTRRLPSAAASTAWPPSPAGD